LAGQQGKFDRGVDVAVEAQAAAAVGWARS